ncbi:HSP20 family molecular chaperone IbpA [Krasilnikovia cinnamomea]|uniref:HSP20 family molecular chaperone IbpA n=1 Tax=Krasilnikovia cinnamomea TaxID=349313 RepID=A0A4Q7ZRF2_9ACTN|nr:Hsp20/alpha crystallin family protein [Krasilnikovia cinnamomea]RZU53381.1 HSP20 family molecular chaperone IbpA [Krasilnikovia cinnamomea]
MTSLLPRLFGDVTDWFDAEFPRTGQLIRFEDRLSDTEYLLRAELPGVDPEKDVEVTVDHGLLIIRAERREEERGMNRSEFRYGGLQRAVRLPGNADEDHVAATYRDGILEVTVPLKAAEPTGRQIPIAKQE